MARRVHQRGAWRGGNRHTTGWKTARCSASCRQWSRRAVVSVQTWFGRSPALVVMARGTSYKKYSMTAREWQRTAVAGGAGRRGTGKGGGGGKGTRLV